MKFIDFMWFLAIFANFSDLGGPGHPQNINIPIGISTFFSMGPPGALQVAQEVISTKIY